MEWNALFFLNSALLGAALAMDAFSVSIANGLAMPGMSRREEWRIAGAFSFFQFLMPLIGWVLVRKLTETFNFLTGVIPWAALILLSFLGIRMILQGLAERKKPKEVAEAPLSLSLRTLCVQALATSMDALSAGLATGEYGFWAALVSCLIIAAVTLALCLIGVRSGRRAGAFLAGWATVAGGVILVLIGLEIFINGLT